MTDGKTVVLVADEDPTTRQFLLENLTADGYDTLAADGPDEALNAINEGGIDIVVADLNGYTVQFVTDCATQVSMIVLSTRADDSLFRCRVLDAGAADVQAKPFSYHELRLRVAAVARRGREHPRSLRIGGVTINTRSREVHVGGVAIATSAKEYALLVTLASEPTRVFSKEELMRAVWGTHANGTSRTLDSHACRLRSKLGVNGECFVVNIWGVGYRFVDAATIEAVAA